MDPLSDPQIQLLLAVAGGAVFSPLAMKVARWVRNRRHTEVQKAVALLETYQAQQQKVPLRPKEIPWNFRPHEKKD